MAKFLLFVFLIKPISNEDTYFMDRNRVEIIL